MAKNRDLSEFDSITIEPFGAGATYRRDKPTVYGYGTYESSSVLAGRPRRVYLGEFESIELAKAAFPTAEITGGTRFYAHQQPDVRPSWCTPEYEAENGERWSDD